MRVVLSFPVVERIGALCDGWALGYDHPDRARAHQMHGDLINQGITDDDAIVGRVREALEFNLGALPGPTPPEAE